MMDVFFQDLRYATRSLRRNVLFAAMTVLTLGLGIGVISALFAVVDAVLLSPIAPDQDRVVRIWRYDFERGDARHPLSYAEFKAWRESNRSFEALAAIQYGDGSTLAFTIDDRPVPTQLMPVSAGFFEIMHGGVPLLGRWFSASDDVKEAEPVAVVSERFWRRVAGGDPSFVGRRLTLAGGGRSVVVVGIAPSALDYPLGTDVWMPIAAFFGPSFSTRDFDTESRGFVLFNAIGRLSSGVSLAQAQAELEVVHRQWISEGPDGGRLMRVVVQPLLNTMVGNSRQILLFLFAAAGLVFVIAGVNVAALLLMRASARRTEVAVRVALGASYRRLLRQMLTESVVLGSFGAACGLLFAVIFLETVRWLAPDQIPRIEGSVVDLRMVVFCVSSAVVWVLTFGIAPSWGSRRFQAPASFGSSTLGFRGVRGTTALRVFTIAEIASAVVVAIAAGLLIRSFVQLQGIERGFDTQNMAVVRLLPSARYADAPSRLAFHQELLPQVAAIPGVVSVAPIHLGPGTATVGLGAPLIFEGQSDEEARKNQWATWEPVMPSYFQTLGIPIVRGRAFTDADARDAQPVAVISEAMAQRYWPGQDPIGKQVKFIAEFPWATVVGVARDTRYRELTKTWLTVYFPAPQFFFFEPGSLVVRTASAPEGLIPAIRQTIERQDRSIAINWISTMEALAAKELSRPRTALTVAGLFALMAILLAAVGVYAVMSYEVGQRRRELAVRAALGASPAQVFGAVLRRSVVIGVVGTAIGLVMALLATQSLRALLFEVSPADPSSFATAAAALLGIVLLASYVPARRAASLDTVAVLRKE